jgi:hypothetical protein
VLAAPLMLLATAIGGPLSLAVAGWYVGLGRAPRARWLRIAMLAAPLLMGIALIVPRVVNDGWAAFALNRIGAFDFYAALVLLSLLPGLGAVHLRRLFADLALRLAHPEPGSR